MKKKKLIAAIRRANRAQMGFKLIKSKPPTNRLILSRLHKEVRQTKMLAADCFNKFAPNAEKGVLLAVPETTHGKTLAEIRNELGTIRVYLTAMLYGTA